jgi:hypothetical protein
MSTSSPQRQKRLQNLKTWLLVVVLLIVGFFVFVIALGLLFELLDLFKEYFEIETPYYPEGIDDAGP